MKVIKSHTTDLEFFKKGLESYRDEFSMRAENLKNVDPNAYPFKAFASVKNKAFSEMCAKALEYISR